MSGSLSVLDTVRPTRRELLLSVAAAGAASKSVAATSRAVGAVAFDAFVLFNPAELQGRAQEFAGSRTPQFMAAATSKLFAYTWFYTSAGRYREFEELAATAFRSAAASNDVALTDANIRNLTDAYSQLDLWDDVPRAIDSLRRSGIRLAVLSNLPERWIRANLSRGGIEGAFEHVLSTDRIARYKPSPEAYQLGVSAFAIDRERIAFAASAAWDATGSTWFGFPTAWVNRTGSPGEQADVSPRIISQGIDGVLRIAGLASSDMRATASARKHA